MQESEKYTTIEHDRCGTWPHKQMTNYHLPKILIDDFER